MKIFHYHPDNGLLLGEGRADLSPLEPDVWLIPAHATAEEPPTCSDSEQVVRVDNAWVVQPIPEPEPEPAPPSPVELQTEIIERSPEEKLAAAGLTVDELKQLLGL